ncbi:MAG: DUF2905 domain-containing protein [Alphaproteobacteria bacterium]|nr:MAG: DUF2905 domain-containing protein [Alphaproteobacteria bacterium]
MARMLIVIGVLFILAGVIWALAGKLGLGRLPGDIVIERENARIWIPVTSAILVSVAVTVVINLILWLIGR